MKKIWIYGLKCPIAGVIRYVGKSENPHKRFIKHIAAANRNEADHHTSRWLRKLIAQGLRPELVILREVGEKERWQDVEREFIAMAEMQGWRLTNSTAGGEGLDYLDPVAKAKYLANLSRSMRFLWNKPERRIEAKERSLKSWSDKECRERRLISLRRNGESIQFRQKMAKVNKKIHERPEVKIKHAEAIKLSWADPEKNARRIAALSSEETRQKMSEKAKARHEDPQKRAAFMAVHGSAECKEKKRLAALRRATPEYRAMMAEKTRLSWEKRRK